MHYDSDLAVSVRVQGIKEAEKKQRFFMSVLRHKHCVVRNKAKVNEVHLADLSLLCALLF